MDSNPPTLGLYRTYPVPIVDIIDFTGRQTAWPGKPATDAVEDVVIGDRGEDFVQFVIDGIAQ